MTNGHTRRAVLASLGTLSAVTLAGCSSSDSQKTATKQECFDAGKLKTTLDVGESAGVVWYSEHWKFTIARIAPDDAIDVDATKKMMDGEGQDKEGVDATTTFERSSIEPDELVAFEPDVQLYYAGPDDGGARIAVGQSIDAYCNR